MDGARFRAAERALWAHWEIEPTERWVETDGPRLRVLELGDPSGSPVLFVHGAMVAGSSWGDLAARLPDHRCLLLDRPGCGLSQPLQPVPSLPELAGVADELVPRVLDGLDVERAHLVGNSMGGLFALRGAAAVPERVRSVTLLGWTLGAPVHRVRLFMQLATHPVLAPLAARVPASRRSVRAMLRATGLADAVDSGRLPEVGIDWNVALQNDTDTRRNELAVGGGVTFQQQIDALAVPEETLSRITAPVRIVFGSRDPFGDEATMQQLADTLPDGRLEVWEGAGHAVWLDDLDRAVAAVREVLSAT